MPDLLPKRLQRYWPLVVSAAERHHQDPCFVAAVLDRETVCGAATVPKGPTGTGDWTPRLWSRYQTRSGANAIFHGTSAQFRHWRPTVEEFRRHFPKHRQAPGEMPPELCMPADGQGFGRGLMQIDYAYPPNAEFLAKKMPDGTPAWQDAAQNIDAGAAMLAHLVRIFQGDEWLAAAGYNADFERVQAALLAMGGVGGEAQRHAAADALTTGRNYASDVIGRREHFRRCLAVPPHDSVT